MPGVIEFGLGIFVGAFIVIMLLVVRAAGKEL